MTSSSLHMIVYISDTGLKDSEIDRLMADIVTIAKKENARHRITGVLFHADGKFLQVVEGREADLRRLMANIEKDPRHTNIQIIIDTPVMDRGFRKWNMDGFHLGKGKVFDKEVLDDLTKSFQKILMPRSDLLVRYYKTLLQEKSA